MKRINAFLSKHIINFISLLLSLLFLNGSTYTQEKKLCEIRFHDKVYIINSDQSFFSFSDFLETYSCSDFILNKIMTIITTYQGEIKGKYLENILRNNFGDIDFIIHPDSFLIENLSSLSKRILNIPLDNFIRNIHTNLNTRVLILKKDEDFYISCANCTTPGRKTLKLIKVERDGEIQKQFFFTAEILEKKLVLVSKQGASVSMQHDLTEIFEDKLVEVNNPTGHFLDKSNLKFYKLNKEIPKGHILTYSDLMPKKLIKVGDEVNIEIRYNGINLKVIGIAKASGSLGEKIEFFNPKSKKHFAGIITDFNRAKVDL